MTLRLAATEAGAGSPVVILHGLFGSARNWQGIARRLGANHRIIALDLRNHGASPWDPSMTYADMAGDVAAFVAERGLAATAMIGHSMGGKAAMVLALTRPDLVSRLVVVDIAPVVYPHDRFAGLVRSLIALDLAAIRRRADADRLLAPLIADVATRQFLLQNLVEIEGRFEWRMNLAAILANLAEIAAIPALKGEYRGPALFVHGTRSNHVLPEHEPAIRRIFPKAAFAAIDGAGHWVHADRPEAFVEAVARFLTG
jgi:pimeloyl-ACP methyl ester carboxylesterase